MHGVKGEAEVRLAQQRLQGVKIKNGAQQLQVILYRVDDLDQHSSWSHNLQDVQLDAVTIDGTLYF